MSNLMTTFVTRKNLEALCEKYECELVWAKNTPDQIRLVIENRNVNNIGFWREDRETSFSLKDAIYDERGEFPVNAMHSETTEDRFCRMLGGLLIAMED